MTTRAATMIRHEADLDRYAAEARDEFARCLARGDMVQARFWSEKVKTFEKSAAFWRGNAATFAPKGRTG